MAQRRRGRDDHLRQHQPFERPGGARALVLMHQRLMLRAEQRGVEAGERDQRLGAHRVGFVRHRRGAAAFGEFDFADFVLRHQRDIRADLAERARDQRRPGRQFGERVALDMPARSGGKLQAAAQVRRRSPRPCRRDRRARRRRRRTGRRAGAGRNSREPLRRAAPAVRASRAACRRRGSAARAASACGPSARSRPGLPPTRCSVSINARKRVSNSASTGFSRRTRLVSMTSWLVAPR